VNRHIILHIVFDSHNGDDTPQDSIDVSKASNLVSHGRVLTKLATWGVDSRVVVWVSELLVGRTEMVRVGG